MSVSQGENIGAYLKARPIMRLRNKFEEAVLFLLNLRSFALTRETYFRSRKSMTPAQVVSRMHPIFQDTQNEHFYHTALADFPGELGVFLEGDDLHARIILSNTNHLFRMEALKALFSQKIFSR